MVTLHDGRPPSRVRRAWMFARVASAMVFVAAVGVAGYAAYALDVMGFTLTGTLIPLLAVGLLVLLTPLVNITEPFTLWSGRALLHCSRSLCGPHVHRFRFKRYVCDACDALHAEVSSGDRPGRVRRHVDGKVYTYCSRECSDGHEPGDGG